MVLRRKCRAISARTLRRSKLTSSLASYAFDFSRGFFSVVVAFWRFIYVIEFVF